MLAKDGWIRAEHGMGWRVLGRPAPAPRSAAKKVGLLCFVSLDQASHFALLQIDKLQDCLHRAGYGVEIHAASRYASQNSRSAIERLVQKTRASHWILLGAPPKVQQWFFARKIVAFASLNPYGDFGLPSLRVDTRPVYRHAVGMLLGLGHQRIVWFAPNNMTGVDEIKFHGYREAVEPYKDRPGFVSRVVSHTGTVDSIRRNLDGLFRGSSPPTALLVVRPAHSMAVLSYLTHAGIAVPRDVSVISIGHEPYLNNLTPSLAHYATNRTAYVRMLCRAVLPWIETGRAPTQATAIVPEHHEGDSVGPAKGSAE